MDWYYAHNDSRKGPVSEPEIKTLISSGKITASTLVWNNTMPDWQAASTTRLFPGGNQPPAVPSLASQHTCIVTGRTFPESQMLKTEHGWVSAEGKERYFQALREGAPIPLGDGQSNARADGKHVVIPVSGGRLPLRCVKTNQPVTEDRAGRKTLYWCTPWVFLALLANILIVAILYFVLRKKVILDIPLSPEGQGIVTRHRAISWFLFFSSIAAVITGIATTRSSTFGPLVVVGGILLLLIALLYGGRKAHALRVAKLKDGRAWLTGACPEFIASLPRDF